MTRKLRDDCFLHDDDRLRHGEALAILRERVAPVAGVEANHTVLDRKLALRTGHFAPAGQVFAIEEVGHAERPDDDLAELDPADVLLQTNQS